MRQKLPAKPRYVIGTRTAGPTPQTARQLWCKPNAPVVTIRHAYHNAHPADPSRGNLLEQQVMFFKSSDSAKSFIKRNLMNPGVWAVYLYRAPKPPKAPTNVVVPPGAIHRAPRCSITPVKDGPSYPAIEVGARLDDLGPTLFVGVVVRDPLPTRLPHASRGTQPLILADKGTGAWNAYIGYDRTAVAKQAAEKAAKYSGVVVNGHVRRYVAYVGTLQTRVKPTIVDFTEVNL